MAAPLKRLYSVEQNYAFIEHIGRGSYAEVYKVVPINKIETKTPYVLKRINLPSMSDNALKEAEREADLISSLKHPNIVRYIESFQSWDFYLNIVMVYYEGGDLYTKINQKKSSGQMFEEQTLAEWCIQICMALQYIHQRNILHRDIKPQNIFLSKDEIIKLGDFGISRVLNGAHDLATTMIGTPYYMSPEVFSHIPYNQKSDIWALGCCMHELATLEHAFSAKDMNSLIVQVTQGHIPKIRGNYSDELKREIQGMLSMRPEDRPTANSILNKHSFKLHLVNMIADHTGRRSRDEDTSQKQKKASTAPLTSELMNLSLMDTGDAARTSESFNDARKRRRQRVAAERLSSSDTVSKSANKFHGNSDGTPTSTDELEKSGESLAETLSHHLKQIEEKHKDDDDDDVQLNFTSAAIPSPGVMDTRESPRPPAIKSKQLINQDQYAMRSRFSDIGNLPNQTLLPITGYTEEPLKSLENAIQSVRDLIAGIDAAIRVARANAEIRHGSLSVDESAAIQLYTMETLPFDRCLYCTLNKTLRSVNRRDLVPWFSYLKLLITALWKLPSFQGEVWRGIKDVDLSKEYEQGKCYTWWNLSSCTTEITVLETSKFLGKEGPRTLFNIHCLHGKEIKQHSYLHDEYEILLLPGTYFKVAGKIDAGGGLHIIRIEELPPPYELISPPF